MLTKNLKQTLIKHICAKYTLISVFSCLMLFICGVLATPVDAAVNAKESPSLNSTTQQAGKATRQIMRTAKQDPTRPPSVVVAQLAKKLEIKPEYQLTAIFTRNQQQYAIVNGEIVTTGDSLANMYVSNITTSSLSMHDRASSKEIMVLELSGAASVKKQAIK